MADVISILNTIFAGVALLLVLTGDIIALIMGVRLHRATKEIIEVLPPLIPAAAPAPAVAAAPAPAVAPVPAPALAPAPVPAPAPAPAPALGPAMGPHTGSLTRLIQIQAVDVPYLRSIAEKLSTVTYPVAFHHRINHIVNCADV